MEAACRAAEDADARASRFAEQARAGLGPKSRDWLARIAPGHDLNPVAVARASEEEYWEARDLLRTEVAAEAERQRVEQWRESLRARARQSAKPEHGHVFLHSSHPRCRGRRPIGFCQNEAGYALVGELLDQVIKR